ITKIAPPRGKALFSHYKELKKIIGKGNYDAVHANTSYHSGFVVLAAKKYGVKVRIVHSRTTDYGRRSLVNTIAAVVGKLLINMCATDRLAISRASGEFLFGKRKDVLILPNAFDLKTYFSDTAEKENKLKRKYELDGCTVVGNVGRFVASKNQKFAIDIFKEFLKQKPDSKLIFVGDGETFAEVKEYAKTAGLSEKIVFLGSRDDVYLWMKIFDVLVFPSEYEGLGNVAIEAQAAGTPCVCSEAVPGEVDMELGLVSFMPLSENAEKWCDEVVEMYSCNRPAKELIRENFDKRKYTIESEVKQLSEIYSRT
ncbi:MAG: glycosyltransferase, partial [Clostridia bacterium]|nr:glycosyltransferase [Clostridia bacterium]